MEKDTILALICTIVIFLGLFWLANELNHSQCKNNVNEMGREYRYDYINGCRVQLKDGTFIYWQMYKEVNN